MQDPKDYWLLAIFDVMPNLLQIIRDLEDTKTPLKRESLVARAATLTIKNVGFSSTNQNRMFLQPDKKAWIFSQIEQALFQIIDGTNLISPIETPFAPTRFKAVFTDELEPNIIKHLHQQFSLTKLSNTRKELDHSWFVESLNQIINDEIESAPSDNFETEVEPAGGEWAPLPLDYNTQETEETILKIEKAVKAIESDNGYSATFPEERDGVVEVLKRSVNDLHDQVSFQKYYFEQTVIKPLVQASKRLGGNAAGKVVEGALEAIKTLVKDSIVAYFKSLQ